MRRTALLTFAAALALAACTDAGSPETEGTGGEPAGSAAGPAEPGANESPDPTATLTSPATRGTTAIPTATATPTTASRSVDSSPAGDECGASKVAPFVSLVATPAVRARLAAKVGHDRIRWVGPDTAVTMDFRPDRLNVALDKANVITGGKCS